MTINPLLVPSPLPYQLPPFAEIKAEHFLPAFEEAFARHDAEISRIVENAEAPTWENTVEALEASGQDLDRAASIFSNLSGTDASAELDAIAEKFYPQYAAHADAIYQNSALYERLQAVTPPEDEESQRLHSHLLRMFVRKGAALEESDKARLSEINQRLSALSEQFGRNLLADTRARAVHFSDAAQLAGLPQSRIDAAAAYAEQVGRDGYVIPLELPTNQSEQARLALPESRAALFEASNLRGSEVNAAGLVEAVRLRAERAQLLGFETHADYVIAEETAGEAAAAKKMLFDLAPAAATNAAGEHKLLAEEAGLHDQGFAPADWPYWESKVRARDFSLDEEELRKYFPLDRVLTDGVFEAARRLYGITVEPRDDLQGYAEGVRVWEVFGEGEDGKKEGIGLLLTDYFARPSKRGGAWMSSFRDQSRLLESKPVIVNVMGITKPADGSTPLLSIDELHTVFHEFGHALHGLLSDVRYPTFSGTNVPRDWVEFPSQINENWALDPSLVKNYAFHVETGEPIPDDLLAAVDKAKAFGQGFATVEYLAASIIDLAWHSLTPEQAKELEATPEAIDAFEAEALAAAGLGERAPEGAGSIRPRYRSTYFNHIFAGGYSAGYYSYLWAEVLDADGFEWFRERGAAGSASSPEATRAAGQKFRDLILSRGAARDFKGAYSELRGRDKDLAPLLKRRGLSGA
ncbi:M3 family metallopeptidase [Corynebacterium endometrii]|uniref:Peptidyl-dipeptidase dcp n=1 Tax=Corynebacterium endometrii TaxID=2488819 RepID=A0A4P7QGM5_9CORY|nr:M3 family metallopeptidase [Corynebacterium endometrii]QCB27787.1 Peptidyl-dipeptidase dcp [Corynebacterium endometrii]